MFVEKIKALERCFKRKEEMERKGNRTGGGNKTDNGGKGND
jgi:hypothetical protein